jgi:hypothetical protein
MNTFTKVLGIVFFLLFNVSNTLAQDLIKIGIITNEIKLGSLANSRNLEVGVRNIVEELLLDLDYDLNPNAEKSINIRLVFFDVKNTGMNAAVFQKKVSKTEIIAIGELQEGTKVTKKTTQKGESSEISNSTLIVASDGSFNQQTASIALKKVLVQIVEDLLK